MMRSVAGGMIIKNYTLRPYSWVLFPASRTFPFGVTILGGGGRLTGRLDIDLLQDVVDAYDDDAAVHRQVWESQGSLGY